jgi:hypothetical protein
MEDVEVTLVDVMTVDVRRVLVPVKPIRYARVTPELADSSSSEESTGGGMG